MKYIKSYEGLDNGPQVGDYVVFTIPIRSKSLGIGKLLRIDLTDTFAPYKVEKGTFWWVKNILFYSSSREDCELFINASKYNI